MDKIRKTILVQSNDICDPERSFALTFLVPSDDFDLLGAIRAAVAEYLETDDGKLALKDTCGCFNMGDFDTYVPDWICKKHGFEPVCGDRPEIFINEDTQLINV